MPGAPAVRKAYVFAYGSNLDVGRMVGRVPSARLVGPSSLPGHELRFHKRGWKDGTGKANAHRNGDAGAAVHGVVYEVDEAELAELDVHETGYERRRLDFAVTPAAGPETIGAWVYLASPDVIDDELLPTRWYLDHVLHGARAHGLPGPLIDWLERHPTDG